MTSLLDKQTLAKKILLAIDETLLDKASKNYAMAFGAIDGKIAKFVNEVAAAIDKKFEKVE